MDDSLLTLLGSRSSQFTFGEIRPANPFKRPRKPPPPGKTIVNNDIKIITVSTGGKRTHSVLSHPLGLSEHVNISLGRTVLSYRITQFTRPSTTRLYNYQAVRFPFFARRARTRQNIGLEIACEGGIDCGVPRLPRPR